MAVDRLNSFMGVDDMNRSNQSETESGNTAININIAEMSLSLMHGNMLQLQIQNLVHQSFKWKQEKKPHSAQIL